MSYEWLSELKTGDEVVLLRSHCNDNTRSIRIVSKATPTLIRIDRLEFYKKDGRERGRRGYGTYLRLEPATPANREAVRQEQIRRSVQAVIRTDIRDMSMPRIEVLHAALVAAGLIKQ